ncbi:MAG: hypothetical protein M3Y27_12630 [Acidobacteriota bacterium]|nr:hypothetical protein [Acidobacteriota bacterium]
MTTGDFNGDGVLDLALANGGDNSVTILLGTTPALALSVIANGGFYPGQSGASYTATVTNSGAVSSSGQVTANEITTAGLLVSLSGAGWSCQSGATFCSRSDALAPGASYPPLTITVNVDSNAPRTGTQPGRGERGRRASRCGHDFDGHFHHGGQYRGNGWHWPDRQYRRSVWRAIAGDSEGFRQ